MDFNYRQSTLLTVHTVRTAQTGTISIQITHLFSYPTWQHQRHRKSQFPAQPACFHASSSTLPLQGTEPTVFFSIWISFFLGAVNISSMKTGCQPKKQHIFFDTKREKNPASINLKLCICPVYSVLNFM